MRMVKHKKPESFYAEFTRKGEGTDTTHYCPGCGHGTVHKLIAETLDDFGLKDRTILLLPVGCSVFAYYYFDTGNIQCAHGRAPAVASAVRRVHDDAIIISYQGDGDLAGIGTSEIIHAANRGDNFTVFFVNNAIYGMTGGQMAPTTLLGQKTMTTPLGRLSERDGGPIGMAEVINALNSPVYIERVSLSSPQGVLKARKAVRKGLQYQAEKRGFSFVEILSPCPINWKMDPVAARKWQKSHMEPVFPPGCFRDRIAESEKVHHAESSENNDAESAGNSKPTKTPGRTPGRTPGGRLPCLEGDELRKLLLGDTAIEAYTRTALQHDQHVKIAGFGGQGVLSAGVLLAKSGIAEGLHASWLPSYGPEMRGGHAYASVNISEKPIGSPLVDAPNVLAAMNEPSLAAFENDVVPGGIIIVNSSIVQSKVSRTDIQAVYVPATEIAQEAGLTAAANVVMITLYCLLTKALKLETLKRIIPLSVKRKEFVEKNLDIVERARVFAENLPSMQMSHIQNDKMVIQHES